MRSINLRITTAALLSSHLGLLAGFAQTSGTGNTAPEVPALQQPPPARPEQARLTETMALMAAAEKGDLSARPRLNDLAAAVRQDKGLPEHDRFVIASRLNGLAIAETPGLDRAGRLAAYERSAREMVAAFPGEPEPYYSLLALAEDQPDPTLGAHIARDLLAMPAPPEAKARAQILLDREAMVGRAFTFSFHDSTGNLLSPEQYRGKLVVLYVWTGRSQSSATWVGNLVKQGGDQVVYIGLNFDEDRQNAETLVKVLAPGSVQVYDPTGLAGDTARQLRLTRVPAIYLIDQAGVLQDVRARENFPAKLSALLAKGGGS